MTRDPLSVIVFADSTPISTINAGVLLVFAFLMIFYALPFALILSISAAKQEYPLDLIWPCVSRVPLYAHLLVAYVAVLLTFGLTYSRADLVDCVVRWPMLLAYAGFIYPALQRERLQRWVKPAARVVLGLSLLWLVRHSWTSVFVFAFLLACVPRVERAIERSVRRLRLPHLYPLVTLATLTVVAVARLCLF